MDSICISVLYLGKLSWETGGLKVTAIHSLSSTLTTVKVLPELRHVYSFKSRESSFVERAKHTVMQVNTDSQLKITLCSHFWSIGNFIHSLSSPMITSVWVCLICLTTWERTASSSACILLNKQTRKTNIHLDNFSRLILNSQLQHNCWIFENTS